MIKTIWEWVIIDWCERIISDTVRRTRRESIDSWLSYWGRPPYTKWKYWYRKGYRAIKVEIVPEGPEYFQKSPKKETEGS